MPEELIRHALNLLLDDRRIENGQSPKWGRGLAAVVHRIASFGPYTAVTSELIDAAKKLNEKAAIG